MFEYYIKQFMEHNGFKGFSIERDIYWGDLGVDFAWDLESIPKERIRKTLGVGEVDGINQELLGVLLEDPQASKDKGVTVLRPAPIRADPLVAAAERDPAALIRAIVSREAMRFDPLPPVSAVELSEKQVKSADAQGEQLALLAIAADEVARQVGENRSLIQGETDAIVVEKIRKLIEQKYEEISGIAEESEKPAEVLGGLREAYSWTIQQLGSMIDGAKGLAVTAVGGAFGVAKDKVDQTKRAATLLVYDRYRDRFSQLGLRFFGDVLVYLHNGRTAERPIFERVQSGVRAVHAASRKRNAKEPVVVVTHSFGSMILYDILSSGGLDDVKIDLWVSVGAQTSLFAEMQLFTSSPKDVPGTGQQFLGRPKEVTKWVNVYDAADALSYKHEPVFGEDHVTDILMRDRANFANAHGHYFLTPSFYTQIVEELDPA